MPVMQMWFWLATDQSLPTAEIFRYQKSEGFVTCFWINPTGSCCWIGPASSWGIPSLSRDARRDRCDGWHAASRQILGVNDTIVLLEPSLPNATKQGWTKIWEIEQAWWKYMCNYVFFFSKNIEVNWEGEKNRQKKWIVAPSSRLFESLIWGWLAMLLWRWGAEMWVRLVRRLQWSTKFPYFVVHSLLFTKQPWPWFLDVFGVCKWRKWMRDRLRSWIVGPWVVVFGMFTCRIRAWDYEVVPCILSAHGHNGENAKGRNEVIIIWQELSWDQRSKCHKWVVAEGNSLKVDRFKWLDMYLTYLWSFYVIKYLIDWCESFEKAYNWRKHVSTQPRAKKSADFQMLTLFQYITPFNLQTDMRIGMVGHSCLDCHRSSPIQWGVYPIAAARRWTIGRH